MPLYSYLDTRPVLGERVYIAPNATVIGDVHIGDDASIWFGVVIRGDQMPIRIGARSNIQDNSVVHITGGKAATTVGDDVTVGHMVLLHGCTVGHRVLIGMGSTLLDGSVVEDDAVVGAGSLLTPRMRIPKGMLAVGRPAKVVRELTEAERAWVKEAGQTYVDSGQVFAGPGVKRID